MDGFALFNAGQKLTSGALEAQRQQALLEKQLQAQALAEARAIEQARYQAAAEARRQESADDLERHREQNLTRQLESDQQKRLRDAAQFYKDLPGEYANHVNRFQTRYDSLGREYDSLLTKQQQLNPSLQYKIISVRDTYNDVARRLAEQVGRSKDINRALTTAYGEANKSKLKVSFPEIRGILEEEWKAMVAEGVVDPAVAEERLRNILMANLQEKGGYDPASLEQFTLLENRLKEVDAERQRLGKILAGADGVNQLEDFATYVKSRYGPYIAALQGSVSPGELSPPATNKERHYATGLAVIGSLPNGRPVHIRPEAWGGTFTGSDGKVQVVPSVYATMADIVQIEKLNKHGKKILTEPLIEDAVDIPLKEPKAPPIQEGMTQPVSQLKQTNATKQDEQVLAQLNELEKTIIPQAAKSIGDYVKSFKTMQNPNVSYEDFLSAISGMVQEITASMAHLGVKPEGVYAALIEELTKTGVIGQLSPDKSTKDKLGVLTDNWRHFHKWQLGPAINKSDPRSILKQQDVVSSPWMRGSWVVPSADVAGYQALQSWNAARQQPQTQR